MKADILMTGVGGQGVILASDALAEIAMKAGCEVKKSDSLGMSQRGGSVVSHLRMGERVFSPMIKKGGADFLLGFERLEGVRWVDYLREGGVAIINNLAIPPLSVVGGALKYPAELGNPQVLNVLLVGFLSAFLDIDERSFIDDLSQRVPQRFLQVNLKAFARGREEALHGDLAKRD
ncbi:MAG: indolepyruvate oxidoreductase subunit beta [Anaerolineae bacterium]|nr:indolepyruvate oxidoreductase subunit beta [Anaerolineae bacterium]